MFSYCVTVLLKLRSILLHSSISEYSSPLRYDIMSISRQLQTACYLHLQDTSSPKNTHTHTHTHTHTRTRTHTHRVVQLRNFKPLLHLEIKKCWQHPPANEGIGLRNLNLSSRCYGSVSRPGHIIPRKTTPLPLHTYQTATWTPKWEKQAHVIILKKSCIFTNTPVKTSNLVIIIFVKLKSSCLGTFMLSAINKTSGFAV